MNFLGYFFLPNIDCLSIEIKIKTYKVIIITIVKYNSNLIARLNRRHNFLMRPRVGKISSSTCHKIFLMFLAPFVSLFLVCHLPYFSFRSEIFSPLGQAQFSARADDADEARSSRYNSRGLFEEILRRNSVRNSLLPLILLLFQRLHPRCAV